MNIPNPLPKTAYSYQPYPKAIYHRTLPPCKVYSREEHDAMGPGWAESPAAFTEPAEPPQQSEPAPTSAPRSKRTRKATK